MIYTISIPKKPISWNVLARQNHWKYTQIFNDWKMETLSAVRKAKIPKISSPCSIEFFARWKGNRRHDIDSLCVKPIVDQIVTMGVFQDDNIHILKSVTFRGETECEKDELILTISLN